MNRTIPYLLGFLLTAISLWILIDPSRATNATLTRLEHMLYDVHLRAKLVTDKSTPNPAIAIIDIDDQSLQREGRWPWPRSKMAKLITNLAKQEVAVIAIDILYSEAEINALQQVLSRLQITPKVQPTLLTELKPYVPLFDDDAELANQIKKVPVSLAIGFSDETVAQNVLPPAVASIGAAETAHLVVPTAKGYISSLPVLQQAAKNSGFLNIYPDGDGITRRMPLFMAFKQQLYPNLGLAAVMAYWHSGVTFPMSYGFQVDQHFYHTDVTGALLIPFISGSKSFPYFSASAVLNNELPAKKLKNKIVFIGSSAVDFGDLRATAIQSLFPTVEMQATIANGLLEQNFSYQPHWGFIARFILIILFGILASLIFPRQKPFTLAVIIVGFAPLVILINHFIWQATGILVSIILPILTVISIALVNVLYGFMFESKRREKLRTLFSQYVPSAHIDELFTAKSNLALQGEDRDMSVLFADIRDFTSLSERLSAKQLVTLLNMYLTPMTEIIFKHGGTIDKYVGDLIMAFWGAPLPNPHHAEQAISAAIAMQCKLLELNEQLKKQSIEPIRIGIGINSGMMIVGDMGSQFRLNYTVLGDAVNLASRLEGLCKFYGAAIIVSESTQANQSRFIFRQLDRVRVKGKAQSIAIYEVLGEKSQLTPAILEELNYFNQALEQYFAKDWDAALAIMDQLASAHPQDQLYALYVERLRNFKHHPPAANWDGTYIHTSK